MLALPADLAVPVFLPRGCPVASPGVGNAAADTRDTAETVADEVVMNMGSCSSCVLGATKLSPFECAKAEGGILMPV